MGELQQALQETSARASEAFARAIFPQGHPNRPAATEQMIAAVKSAKLEDLQRFHREHYGPAHLMLIVVGDVDVPHLQADVAQGFSGWAGGSDYSARQCRGGRRRGTRGIDERAGQSEHLGHSRGGDRPAVSRSGRSGVARRHGDIRQRLHESAGGQRA